MLVLFESPAGYALFKCADGKLKDVDNIYKHFEESEDAKKLCVLLVLFSSCSCRSFIIDVCNMHPQFAPGGSIPMRSGKPC